jgi:hypothetical protein
MRSHSASGGYKYRGLVLREGGWAWGLEPYAVKKKIVEKPPRNSAGFCGGGHGLNWAVKPRKEEEVTNQNCINEEIKRRLNKGNALPPFCSEFSAFQSLLEELKDRSIQNLLLCMGVKLGLSH